MSEAAPEWARSSTTFRMGKRGFSMAKLRRMELETQHFVGIGRTGTGFVDEYLGYGKSMVCTSKTLSNAAATLSVDNPWRCLSLYHCLEDWQWTFRFFLWRGTGRKISLAFLDGYATIRETVSSVRCSCTDQNDGRDQNFHCIWLYS